jgi:H+/Cl- antiporter ClcA
MVVYNALKFMVLRRKMHIQPFALPMLWALFAGLLAWAAVAWMPAFTNPFFGILVKSPLVLGIFGGLVLWWRVSPDVSQLAAGAWGRIKKYWKWRKSWKN